MLAAVREEFAGVGNLARGRADKRGGLLPQCRAGYSGYRDVGHGRVAGQDLLDFTRVDDLGAADDHVREPPGDLE